LPRFYVYFILRSEAKTPESVTEIFVDLFQWDKGINLLLSQNKEKELFFFLCFFLGTGFGTFFSSLEICSLVIL
jgi:hypothetical protein